MYTNLAIANRSRISGAHKGISSGSIGQGSLKVTENGTI